MGWIKGGVIGVVNGSCVTGCVDGFKIYLVEHPVGHVFHDDVERHGLRAESQETHDVGVPQTRHDQHFFLELLDGLETVL